MTDKYQNLAVKAFLIDISVTPFVTIELTNLIGFSINIAKNQATNWSLTLENGDENYSPFNTTARPIYDTPNSKLKLFPDIFNNYFTIKYIILLQIDIAGVCWTSPPLVIQNYDYAAHATEGYLVNLSGTDPTLCLYRDNQSHSSWVSTETTVYHPEYIIEQLLAAYMPNSYFWDSNSVDFQGVIPYITNLTWDYAIPEIHMPAMKPIDLITRLLYVNQGSYFWEGNSSGIFGITFPISKIRITKLANDPIGTPTRIYQAGSNLYSFNYKRSSAGLINQVDVRRTVSMGYLGGDVEGYEHGKFYTLEFTGLAAEKGLILGSPAIWTEMGKIENINYFEQSGLGAGYSYSGDQPPAGVVRSISFLFSNKDFNGYSYPGIAGVDYFPYFHIWFRGRLPITNTQWGQTFASDFAVRVQDALSIAKYGLIPASQIEENPLLPNATWAQIHGTEILRESNRLIESAVIDTKFDPLIQIGDFVLVQEPNSGMWGTDLTTTGRMFQVEGKALSLSGSELSQTLSLVRYVRLT